MMWGQVLIRAWLCTALQWKDLGVHQKCWEEKAEEEKWNWKTGPGEAEKSYLVWQERHEKVPNY